MHLKTIGCYGHFSAKNALPRVLKRFDLVAIYFALVFGSYGAAQMASMGWAAIPMLLLAAVLFLLPCALAAYELGTRIPGTGGIYMWAKQTLGDVHGFISGWLSWVPILLLLPLGVTASTSHLQAALHFEWSKTTDTLLQLGLIWIEVMICALRLKASQKIVRIGFFVSLGTAVTVFVCGLVQPGSATPVTPDITSLDITAHGALFSAAVLWLLGVEMPFTMGGEYGRPKRTAGTMLVWGTLALMAGYLMGIAGILWLLPAGEVDVTRGVAQAVMAHYPVIGTFVAIGICGAVMSQDVAYMNTYSRLLYVAATEKRLPESLGRLNARSVPVRALWVQGIGASAVILVFAHQESLAVAFNLYLAALVVIWCLSLYYIYAALIIAGNTSSHTSTLSDSIWRIPGGRIGRWAVAVWGMIANTVAIYYVFALPWVSEGISAVAWRGWIVAIMGVIILIGLALWHQSRKLAEPTPSADGEIHPIM